MSSFRLIFITSIAMLAFAANSVLCRVALDNTAIDAASFTMIRLFSGAVMLLLLLIWQLSRNNENNGIKALFANGSWWGALALFSYAAAFSFAYIELTAATGALLLFGVVQLSMIAYGFSQGERFSLLQWLGLLLAIAGLLILLLPGVESPPWHAALLMVFAGMAWGVYSLLGARSKVPPLAQTSGNFLRAVPFALVLLSLTAGQLNWDAQGVIYAIASGAIASGMGYAVWYLALPWLKSSHAATIQLSVPVITALGGWLLLSESLTWSFWLASVCVLGGIALVIWFKSKSL
ncbi:DMT family transporter [Thiomicrorhabdus sediminis]|uniref:DMT family transporter n=1 Tax=Thiomicrorhabdus sediminis TaxID=2580412 RepID=A0A4P9K5K8_9GAMM|nr:DMT family transporter [Thiomicrorhabdus sediminis]QCU90304.1 DMT family transporter [Thiomicrorhabdus sediminis]